MHLAPAVATLFLFAAPARQEEPPAPLPPSAQQRVETVLERFVAERDPAVLWRALPPRYRDDVRALLATVARRTDPTVWSRAFELIEATGLVLREKGAFAAACVEAYAGIALDDEQQALEFLSAFGELLITLGSSDMREVGSLATLDVGGYLEHTGASLLETLLRLSSRMPHDDLGSAMRRLEEIEVVTVGEKPGLAVLRLVASSWSTEVDLALVQGKWVPKELADGWAAGVTAFEELLDESPWMLPPARRTALLASMDEYETALDRVAAARTSESILAALDRLSVQLTSVLRNFDGSRASATPRDRARADIVALDAALAHYAINNAGRYPDSLMALVTPDENGQTYLSARELPVDPWGNAYVYEPPADGALFARVVCLGADGRVGGEGAARDLDNLEAKQAR